MQWQQPAHGRHGTNRGLEATPVIDLGRGFTYREADPELTSTLALPWLTGPARQVVTGQVARRRFWSFWHARRHPVTLVTLAHPLPDLDVEASEGRTSLFSGGILCGDVRVDNFYRIYAPALPVPDGHAYVRALTPALLAAMGSDIVTSTTTIRDWSIAGPFVARRDARVAPTWHYGTEPADGRVETVTFDISLDEVVRPLVAVADELDARPRPLLHRSASRSPLVLGRGRRSSDARGCRPWPRRTTAPDACRSRSARSSWASSCSRCTARLAGRHGSCWAS